MATKLIRAHYVPIAYLGAWTDSSAQVALRRRGSSEVRTPNVVNVTVELGGYGRGQVGQAREDMFRQLEDTWPSLRQELVSDGGYVRQATREKVALFAAVQFVRTREHAAQLRFLVDFAAYSTQRPVQRGAIRAFLAEKHLKFEPTEAEVEGAWTVASVGLNDRQPPTIDDRLGISLSVAILELGPRLAGKRWSIEHCTKPILFTSDRPVMCWRPPSARDAIEGIGIDTADETRLPLTPNDLLVMRSGGVDAAVRRVQPRRFQRVNAAVGSQCQDQVIAHRSQITQLEALRLADHRPTVRFNFGPGFRLLPDGTHEPMGDIVHTWTPTHV
jgi:Protein of unknown function (DUF4238)